MTEDGGTPPASSISGSGATVASGLTGTSGRGGRGRHRGRRSGRGAGRSSAGRIAPTATVFEGREDSLKGNVYDIVNTNSSANAFITTTEEIAEFAGRTLKMGNYV